MNINSTALHVRGVVLPDDAVRDLWLVGDRVTTEPVPGAVTVADRGFILPGLVDAHCHIGIARGPVPVTTIEHARSLALTDRDAGVLAIRDAGSPLHYPQFDDDPDLPRLARAGRHLAATRRYLRGLAEEIDVEALDAEITKQAAAGNGWVKIVGDWIDRARGDLAPSWPVEAMAAAVKVAHAAGARVAVHTFEEETVAAMVRAGVDSVEHGTGLALDDIPDMVRQGSALVPTMTNIENFGAIAAQAEPKFPGYAAHMRRLYDRFPSVVASAYQAGVPIYVGTDAGGSVDHGLAAGEMLLLHKKAGMAPLDVLRAGSWGAREWLGFPSLEEGGLADLVVYDSDPRADLRVLQSPLRIVLRGRIVK